MNDEEICIYCNSYWRVGHTDNCPQSTNIYPMSDWDGVDIVCAECREEMEDYYTVIDGMAMCIGCAAVHALLA